MIWYNPLSWFNKKKKIVIENRRFFVYKTKCPHCKHYFGLISLTNSMLPPNKRIQMINIEDSDKYDLDIHSFLRRYSFQGTPFLYLDGISVEGAISKDYCESLLSGLVEMEMVVNF